MSQITVGKPDLRTADQRAIALGKFLRHSNTVQSREGILNGERHDFFKIKRAVRALLEPAYESYRKRVPVLPSIANEEEAYQLLQLFPLNRIAFNVQKLHSEVAQARGLKPLSGIPCLVVAPQQKFAPEEYFAWFYDPVSTKSMLYTLGAIAVVIACIAFPLWPYKLRRMSWYLTMSILGFLVFLIVLAVVRLVLFIVTYFTVKPGLWLFPNLFEDLGILESFKPLYCWHGENALPAKEKKKKRVKTPEQQAAIKAEADQYRLAAGLGAQGQSPAQAQALMEALARQKAQQQAGQQPGQPGQQVNPAQAQALLEALARAQQSGQAGQGQPGQQNPQAAALAGLLAKLQQAQAQQPQAQQAQAQAQQAQAQAQAQPQGQAQNVLPSAMPFLPDNASPLAQQLMQSSMQEIMMRVQARKQEELKKVGGPLSPEQDKELTRRLFTEETHKMKQELAAASQRAQNAQNQ